MFGADRKRTIWAIFKPSTILYFIMGFAEPLWAQPSHDTEAPHPHQTGLNDRSQRPIDLFPNSRISAEEETDLKMDEGKFIGHVEKYVGNFMPGHSGASGIRAPLPGVRIHIFNGSVTAGTESAKKADFITVAGKDGQFSMKLPAGKTYTALIEVDGKLLPIPTDRDNHYTTFFVRDRRITTFNLVDSTKAFH